MPQLVTTGPWYNRQTHIEYHATINCLSNTGQTWRGYDGWVGQRYVSNGYNIQLYVGAQTNGDVVGYFKKPY